MRKEVSWGNVTAHLVGLNNTAAVGLPGSHAAERQVSGIPTLRQP